METMELPHIICTVYRFFEYFEPTYVQIGQMVWEHRNTRDEKTRKKLQPFIYIVLLSW